MVPQKAVLKFRTRDARRVYVSEVSKNLFLVR